MSNPALPRSLDRPNRNLGRELKAQGRFFYFFVCNHLKSHDSQKTMKGNKRKFFFQFLFIVL